jgi:hypothetical protein
MIAPSLADLRESVAATVVVDASAAKSTDG